MNIRPFYLHDKIKHFTIYIQTIFVKCFIRIFITFYSVKFIKNIKDLLTNCALCAIINTEIEKQPIKRKDMIRMKKYSVVVVQEELAEDMMALIASFSGKL